jgi:hypothetical protein
MSQRIIPLVDFIVTDEPVELPRLRVPPSVQTGPSVGRGVRFREIGRGWWSFEIRREHGATFGGPFKGLPAAMTRAARVQLALVENNLAV